MDDIHFYDPNGRIDSSPSPVIYETHIVVPKWMYGVGAISIIAMILSLIELISHGV